jgi:IS30 family transposase
MALRRKPPKAPGGPPLSDKRVLYIDLMSKGVSNSAASRIVGVNRRTGTRWRRGRTIVNGAGQTKTYPPIPSSPAKESGRFLSEAERILIADALSAGLKIREIAVAINRSPSTVSREVHRNSDPASKRYLPHSAQRMAVQRRKRPKVGKLAGNDELRIVVQERLDKRWSPEQIARTLPVDFEDRPEMRICPETIYQALYVPRLGALQRQATRVLRTGRSRRRPHRRLDRRATRFVEPMTMISERPSAIAERQVAGHWEGDLITGHKNRSAIGTLVERKTRYVRLLHLPDGHDAQEVSAELIRVIGGLPAHLRGRSPGTRVVK